MPVQHTRTVQQMPLQQMPMQQMPMQQMPVQHATSADANAIDAANDVSWQYALQRYTLASSRRGPHATSSDGLISISMPSRRCSPNRKFGNESPLSLHFAGAVSCTNKQDRTARLRTGSP